MLQKTPKSETRERLLVAAEAAILAKGFHATSIEEWIAAVGITKSGFFYHFKDKNELARAIMQRFSESDAELVEGIFSRGDELHNDPLHGFFVGLKLFAEALGNVPESHPGCIAASFAYQDQLFDQGIRDATAAAFMLWRRRFQERFEKIAAIYPPADPVDVEALADMAATLVEGGLILGRVFKDVTVLPRQILLYRDYVRRIFQP
jgi:TetR/AcrR family transcriptional regulator, transcriptional repressor for nem operon